MATSVRHEVKMAVYIDPIEMY